jgi:hypothetical protein
MWLIIGDAYFSIASNDNMLHVTGFFCVLKSPT